MDTSTFQYYAGYLQFLIDGGYWPIQNQDLTSQKLFLLLPYDCQVPSEIPGLPDGTFSESLPPKTLMVGGEVRKYGLTKHTIPGKGTYLISYATPLRSYGEMTKYPFTGITTNDLNSMVSRFKNQLQIIMDHDKELAKYIVPITYEGGSLWLEEFEKARLE